MITDLKKLWQEAFGDPESFIDGFFTTGYCPERSMTIAEDGMPVAALYWFDGYANGKKMAYIYAVATKKEYRNRGLCRRLMELTHQRLSTQGYSGAILVPGSESLFGLYEKLGYQTCCYVEEFSCLGQGTLPFTTISAQEYGQRRKSYLPHGAFIQDTVAFDFLETYLQFWAGEDWILAGAVQDGCLQVQEFLGNQNKATAITGALGVEKANFRTLGTNRPFAMYYSLDGTAAPTCFGLPMD